jgi:hypothetical protein
MANMYRFELKTIADHPSQNRNWFTLADGDSIEEAFARILSTRKGQTIQIRSVWLQVA